MRRARARAPEAPEPMTIDGVSHDGRGVAHTGGKVVFVDGALPGERITALRTRRRRGHDEARTLAVLEPSAGRVEPQCAHFGVCGGCVMQHATPELQREIKQQVLADNLARIGRIAPANWLPPVAGPIWRYRRRARLSCRFVEKKGRLLVGFRERGRPYVADLRSCEVLAEPVGAMLGALAALVGGLERAREIVQIELAVADNVTILVVRHLAPLPEGDLAQLRAFGAGHGVEFHLQPAGYDSIVPLDPPGSVPLYRLPEFAVEFEFGPADFLQVNAAVNEAMVSRAVELLAPAAGEAVLDLFCGLGNFTLPLARRAAQVTGVEGDAALVARASANAARNGITNAIFLSADLFAPLPEGGWASARYDKVLLDPPRAGAREVLEYIPRWNPERVVYVSCHPGTLARDAGELVTRHGYTLAAAGIIDMFPHTAHVESIAVFERA